MIFCVGGQAFLRMHGLSKIDGKSEIFRKVCLFIVITLMAFTMVCFFLSFSFLKNDIKDLTTIGLFFALCHNAFVKILNMLYRSEDYKDMCQLLTKMYTDVEQKFDIPSHLSSVKYEKKLHYIVCVMYSSSLTITIAVIIQIFFLEDIDPETGRSLRKLPIRVWYPFDYQISPTYEYVVLQQVLYSYLVQVGINGYLIVCFSLMYYGRRQFIVLQHLLKSIMLEVSLNSEGFVSNLMNDEDVENTDVVDLSSGYIYDNNLHDRFSESPEYEQALHEAHMKMEEKLGDCILYHNLVLSYFKKMNTYLRIIFMNDFLTAMVLLCVGIYSSFEVDFVPMIPIFGITSWTVLYMFLFCWFSSEIKLQSGKVAEAAYMSQWEMSSPGYRKSLLIIMMCAQKEETLTLWNIHSATLSTFITMMQVSYSNYTFLQEMNQKK